VLTGYVEAFDDSLAIARFSATASQTTRPPSRSTLER
jgi:hypothetical protein